MHKEWLVEMHTARMQISTRALCISIVTVRVLLNFCCSFKLQLQQQDGLFQCSLRSWYEILMA